MRRRDLLKMRALAPCVPLILGARTASSTNTAAASRRRVRPTDAAWPGEASWRSLNAAIGSSLMPVPPLLAGCAGPSESAGCADLLQQLRNPFYLGDQPAAGLWWRLQCAIEELQSALYSLFDALGSRNLMEGRRKSAVQGRRLGVLAGAGTPFGFRSIVCLSVAAATLVSQTVSALSFLMVRLLVSPYL
jgi:hypothetical protein